MKTSKPTYLSSLLMPLLAIVAVPPIANSQPITPANDGTGTTVNQSGNQFNIQGGTRNGTNLFHSFDKFNVQKNQTANFLTTPDTRNILGRVTGGASYINGLIQVIGSNSNLYLMNPAGVIFGQNASLNVPASFSVTTATGIGFDHNNYWFQAIGTNDYSNLVGNPSGYRFNVSNPGAIVNQGNLTLNPGENLTLLGGTVINTGELSTAGGNITIAAVEGGNTLRISQPGHLLTLEVRTLDATSLQSGQDISQFTPLSLPQLLTGPGQTNQATSVIVNENGQIVLTDSNTLVADTPGTAIISGNIDVSIPPNPRSKNSAASSGFPRSSGDGRGIDTGRNISSLPLSQGDGRAMSQGVEMNPNSHSPLKKGGQGGSNIGGQVNVLGDRVALLNTNINADGLNGGGTVLIGGDFQGNGIVPNSQQTFVNQNSIISADAIANGDGGRVIIWSDGTTNFAGNISAKGGEFSGDGGFVEVSGKQELIFDGNVNVTAALGNPGTILLDPENIILGGAESNTSLENSQGNIILQADNDITINENIETTESVELKAGRSININADIDTSSGNGNIDILGNNDEMNIANRSDGKASINQQEGTELNAGSGNIRVELGNLGEVGDINLENLATTGGNIEVYSGGKITVRGDIYTTREGRDAGNITINSFNGEIDTSESFIDATAYSYSSPEEPTQSLKGGDISISASGDIKTASVWTDATKAGNITIESRNGNIDTTAGSIDAYGFGAENVKGGNISITANGDIKTGSVSAPSPNQAGNITIESQNGSIDTSEGYIGATANSFGDSEGNSQNVKGGNISISASGDIKTGGIDASSLNQAGNITIESQKGSIDTSKGSISATANSSGDSEGNSQNVKGGNISISASGDIKTGGIDASSGNEGGNITITSSNGAVRTTGGIIRTSSSNPGDQSVTTLQGGDIEVTADSNINSSAFITSGTEAGGEITLTSLNGSVINSNLLDSSSTDSIAGDITVNSEGLIILAGQINTTGNTQGGNINLTSNSSDVDTNAARIRQTSANGTDGNLNITANTGSIEIGEISGSRNIIIADGGESDPFNNDPNTDISSDANQVDRQSGEVHLQAHNDITINEPINGTEISQLELRAGRNINLNADIDTSSSNGNIKLRANDQGADLQYRGEGTGNITMAAETTINAGTGEISIELGNLAEVGDITLSNLQTTGNIIVDANGGNIFRSSENSLITAGNAVFQAPTGSIGTETEPLNITVENLEARSGSGVFFNSPTQGVNIGNASNILPGIYTSSGGEIKVEALGDITVTETLFTASFDQKAGDITFNSIKGAIDTTAAPLNSSSIEKNSGNISLTAAGNINTGNIGSSSFKGDTGNITITSSNGAVDTSNGFIRFPSREGNSGDVEISAFGDIKTGDIISNDIFLSQGGNGGNITIKSSNGGVDTTEGIIGTYANNSNAGNVDISASGNIKTGSIETYSWTFENNNSNPTETENPREQNNPDEIENLEIDFLGNGDGGKITIKSDHGSVDTTEGWISTSSDSKAGDVDISASGDINTGSINSNSNNGDGGKITIDSDHGAVNTTGDFASISSYSNNGTAGNIEIFASGDINTGNINSSSFQEQNNGNQSGKGNGANITITSIYGSVDTSEGWIGTSSNSKAGDVHISASWNINTGNINSNSQEGEGGDITITASNGTINTTKGKIETYSNNGSAGDVNISASGNINTGEIDSYSGERDDISEFGGDNTGVVIITNSTGDINQSSGTDVVENNNLSTTENSNGNAGNIRITSRNGTVDTTAGRIRTYANNNGTAGDVNISAFGNINTAEIDLYSSEGEGGNIEINSINGAVNATNGIIRTDANNGSAGNVKISAFGDINTGDVYSFSGKLEDNRTIKLGEGDGGKITINSDNGSVDTTEGWIGTSADGKAGDIEISASGDINTSDIYSYSDTQGGDISIKSRNGAINTTGNYASFDDPLGPEANITSEDFATKFESYLANLDAFASEGTGGNITLTAKGDITTYEVSSYGENISGDVKIVSTAGNIKTDLIFSTGSNERGGNISIKTPGNITINHIATYSTNGIGGEINLNAGGNVKINNIASFGITDSGDVSIQSNSGNIDTRNIDTLAEEGISGNITLNDFGLQGEISTADINTKGGTEAGGIKITATDGSILTGDLESSSLSGNAGGLILEALRNIETGNQTVIAGIGDASISNNAGNNINVGDQTAMTESGNAMIINNAGNNITTGNQIAVTNDGISIIENNAPGNISTGTVTQLGNNIQSTATTIAAIEEKRNNEFANYLGSNISPQVTSIQNIREVLTDITRQTDNNSAIIYVTAYPEALQLILYTPGNDPILKSIPDAKHKQLKKLVKKLRYEIIHYETDSYLPLAQQLYDWLIKPISAELAAANIDTLLFSMDQGLRTLPVAVLHDGEQFLIEKYSISLIPSVSLMDTNYRTLQDARVLAMGASQFTSENPLPAVPVELETISQQLWQGSKFMNEEFTLNNLLNERKKYPYRIIHLATHAEFLPGVASTSYIQLWGDEKIKLDQIRELGWSQPAVDLLVLSACKTAVGDKNAELGFAGLAVAAGVKSALASLWLVNDQGTLGLMTEFYTHLNNTKIKAEALRQAQLAMLRGEVVIADGELRGTGTRGAVVLPSALGKFSNQNLSHPYYWSGFMMVGSPW